jgi:Icc-related predicted phosphoesterase
MNFDDIYIVGDIHGSFQILDALCAKMEDNSLVVQVGDFGIRRGLNYFQNSCIENIKENLKEKNSQLLVIRGNHDDSSFFDGVNNDGLTFLKDYTRLTINDLEWLFIGGATSIDRYTRMSLGFDLYDDEELVYKEDELEKPCDVLIMHTAPMECFPTGEDKLNDAVRSFVQDVGDWRETMYNDLKTERELASKIYDKVNPKYFYYGHFHMRNKKFTDGKYTRLLKINEIEKFEL